MVHVSSGQLGNRLGPRQGLVGTCHVLLLLLLHLLLLPGIHI
eukprot:COSAG01_NODE_8753_length_2672_cov_1.793626_2_plen_42_part_00